MSAADPEVANRIAAGGIETNYHDEGRGPAVLFIHGSGPGVSAWANWRLTIPALATSYRLIAPDMVGFGFSDRPKGVEYRKETWVRQAVGLLDALGIDKAHVVGNSFGGAIALAMAIRHPERVRSAGPDGLGRRAVPDHARPQRGVGLRAVVRRDAQASSTSSPTTAAS